MKKKCSPKENVHICCCFLTKIEMLIKNLAKSSKNKTYFPIPHPLHCKHCVCEGFLFFSYSCWIVWFQFKLPVSVSQLCTALSNLFLLGISIWNEALLALLYPKQTSVPTWRFNRNWLSSKKMSSKFRKNARDITSRQIKTLSRDANDILLFETAAV